MRCDWLPFRRDSGGFQKGAECEHDPGSMRITFVHTFSSFNPNFMRMHPPLRKDVEKRTCHRSLFFLRIVGRDVRAQIARVQAQGVTHPWGLYCEAFVEIQSCEWSLLRQACLVWTEHQFDMGLLRLLFGSGRISGYNCQDFHCLTRGVWRHGLSLTLTFDIYLPLFGMMLLNDERVRGRTP